MIDKKKLGDFLKDGRRRRCITGKELSAKTGVNESSLSRIERGLLRPSLTNLDKLAQYFGWDLNIIFDKCRTKE